MTDDYEALLERTRAETPTLEMLPAGSYRLKARGARFQTARDDDKNDCVMFIYNPMEPLEDVDIEQLSALGDYDITQNKLYFRIYIEGESDWGKFWTHIDKHGLIQGPEATRKQAMKDVKGSEIIAFLEQRTFQSKAGEMIDTNDPVNFASVEN